MDKVTHVPPSLVYLIDELAIMEGKQLSAPFHHKPIYQEAIDALNRIKKAITEG
jgi:hypothetical protein